ncbi:MAG TPA: hypothetical protein VK151_18185 [Fluviicola sp.]|nr:hypothetical protein [Fluviicola sp.]
MTKQSILKIVLWFATVLYLASLFLPYRIVDGGYMVPGFEFLFPLLGAIFIIPYMLLVYFFEKKAAKTANIVLSSILLFVCIATFFLTGHDIMITVRIGIGAYLFLLVGISFFVIALIRSKMSANKQNDPRVLDQFP